LFLQADARLPNVFLLCFLITGEGSRSSSSDLDTQVLALKVRGKIRGSSQLLALPSMMLAPIAQLEIKTKVYLHPSGRCSLHHYKNPLLLFQHREQNKLYHQTAFALLVSTALLSGGRMLC